MSKRQDLGGLFLWLSERTYFEDPIFLTSVFYLKVRLRDCTNKSESFNMCNTI